MSEAQPKITYEEFAKLFPKTVPAAAWALCQNPPPSITPDDFRTVLECIASVQKESTEPYRNQLSGTAQNIFIWLDAYRRYLPPGGIDLLHKIGQAAFEAV